MNLTFPYYNNYKLNIHKTNNFKPIFTNLSIILSILFKLYLLKSYFIYDKRLEATQSLFKK